MRYSQFFSSMVFVCLAQVLVGQQDQTSGVRFENVSADAGISVPTREPFLAFGDYDSDGDPDLLVDGKYLFRNDCADGKIAFVDVTKETGISAARGPAGCWFDFDLDGWLDFGTASGEVWINTGKGTFVNFSSALGIALPHGSTSAMAWGDVNGDGWLDFFSGGNNKYNPTAHFEQNCWLNSKRKKPLSKMTKPRALKKIAKMENVSAKLKIDRKMYGRSIIFCDFDWDGDEDIYSGNYHLKPNFLFVNHQGELSDLAAEYGVTGRKDPTMFTLKHNGKKIGYQYGHTIGAAWADLNNDGYFDLWVSNLVHKFAGPSGPNFKKATGRDFDVRGYICDDSNLFINQGPPSYHFVDERLELGIKTRPLGGRGTYIGDELWSNAICADLDNNGFIDAFCNQIYGDAAYSFGVLHMNAEGQFTEEHKAAGIEIWGGYGSAIADIDSDGKLDVMVCGSVDTKTAPAIHVFRNTSPTREWIGFDLLEQKGKQTVGAKVLLVQEDGVQIRQVSTTMGSHSQQGDNRVHFGLGDGGEIQNVVIYWPDGRIQSLGQPEVGRYHSIKRRTLRKTSIKISGPKTAKVGQELTFKAKVATKKGQSFEWDFEGSRHPEETGSAPSASYTFEEPGEYVVWVRVTRKGQCGEAQMLISVTEDE